MDAEARVPQQNAAAYSTFCRLWSLAALFHLASYNEWFASIFHFLLLGAALALFCRPNSLYRLLLLCALQVVQLAIQAPMVSNHWLFTGFINATILATYLHATLKKRGAALDQADFYAAFAPLLRLELLLLYFFVVLHKFNFDFFSPDSSCAARFYLVQAEHYSFLPRSFTWAEGAIYFTLACEILIPLLLCLRRTRNSGIMLGLLFHGLISLNPVSRFYNFSSMLFALFFLFGPGNVFALAPEKFSGWKRKISRLSFGGTMLLVAISGAGILFLLNYLNQYLTTPGDMYLAAWILYCLLIIAAFSTTIIKKCACASMGALLAPRHRWLLLLPALVFFNGINPYIGLKTETAFAMYSNLRTEGGRSNHFFIPEELQFFSYQQDLVQITSSSSHAIRGLTGRNQFIPFFELRRFSSQEPLAAVSYWRDGVSTTVGSGANVPELSRPLPLLLRKLLYFRPLEKMGAQKCTH